MRAMITAAKRFILRTILFGLVPMLNEFRRECTPRFAPCCGVTTRRTVQLKDGSLGRHFIVHGGRCAVFRAFTRILTS